MWRQIVGRKAMTVEEHAAAVAVSLAFDQAAGTRPWEHGPLSPRSAGPGSIRDALFAMATEAEVKQWREWEREHDAEEARYTARAEAARRADRERLKPSATPRPIRW